MPQIGHQDGALWSDTKMVLLSSDGGRNERPRFKITSVVVGLDVVIVLSDALKVPSPS
jgi:hypothetical protein